MICSCGHPLDESRCKPVGPQPLGDGDVAILANCPACSSTRSVRVLTDAAVCCDCHHTVLGTTDDPKVVGLVMTTDGLETRVWCSECGANRARQMAA